MALRMFTISHDRTGCIGCGSCELEAPQTWSLDNEEGLSLLKKGVNKNDTWVAVIDELDYEDNLRAAQNCPVNIIRIDKKGV